MTRYSLLLLAAICGYAQSVVLENGTAKMTWELAGGSLVGFELKELPLNPFTWETPTTKNQARARGHFLCLDRWGAPSEAEKTAGMPFHGEASNVTWRLIGKTASDAEMAVQLPLARIAVKRTVRLDGSSAVITESVTNEHPLGRVYNMVQHPTIGPPFLDETTVVDSNARRGFLQSSPMPNPEYPVVVWPQALKDGIPVNLRYLHDDPNPAVVSFVIDDAYGWVTAFHPAKGLLLGYIWKTSEYPWLNIWRHVEGGKPFARGLEFGTTGLHQPYPVLIQKGRILDRPLLAFLDSAETVTRSWQVFYGKAPAGFAGVAAVRRVGDEWAIVGRGRGEVRGKNLLN